MTCAELIALLQKYPGDRLVVVDTGSGYVNADCFDETTMEQSELCEGYDQVDDDELNGIRAVVIGG
jgi:hypothetical protein